MMLLAANQAAAILEGQQRFFFPLVFPLVTLVAHHHISLTDRLYLYNTLRSPGDDREGEGDEREAGRPGEGGGNAGDLPAARTMRRDPRRAGTA